ncbi:MAG: hypothetical protein GXO26_02930 [Crenarchaeota archaeon]|nr:hypothetical protein [Thermoproteota archaeon]
MSNIVKELVKLDHLPPRMQSKIWYYLSLNLEHVSLISSYLLELDYRLYFFPINYGKRLNMDEIVLLLGVPLPEKTGNRLVKSFRRRRFHPRDILLIYEELARRGRPLLPCLEPISGNLVFPLDIDYYELHNHTISSIVDMIDIGLRSVSDNTGLRIELSPVFDSLRLGDLLQLASCGELPSIEVEAIGHIPLVNTLAVRDVDSYSGIIYIAYSGKFRPIYRISLGEYIEMLLGARPVPYRVYADLAARYLSDSFISMVRDLLYLFLPLYSLIDKIVISSFNKFTINLRPVIDRRDTIDMPQINVKLNGQNIYHPEINVVFNPFRQGTLYPTAIFYGDYRYSDLINLLLFIFALGYDEYLRQFLEMYKTLKKANARIDLGENNNAAPLWKRCTGRHKLIIVRYCKILNFYRSREKIFKFYWNVEKLVDDLNNQNIKLIECKYAIFKRKLRIIREYSLDNIIRI